MFSMWLDGIRKSKNVVEKFSKEKKVDVQVAWDTFFFDEFLYRLSNSQYSKLFVFKGGFYLQSIVGIDVRSAIDQMHFHCW